MRENIEYWIDLLESAYILTHDIDKIIRPIRNNDIIKKVLNAYLFKVNRTLAGIILLYKNNFNEEGQILVRTMFELLLDFSFFTNILKTEPEIAGRRIIDSLIIEKAKQLRASNYDGVPENIKLDIEKWESEVKSRYSIDDIRKLRRYGFSMVSVEEKAKLTGHESIYNIMYRNFSRNSHNTDFMESFLQIQAYEADGYEELQVSRDSIAMETTFITIYNTIQSLNTVFKLSFNDRIEQLKRKFDMLKKNNDETISGN